MSFFTRSSAAAKFTPHAFRNRAEYLDRRLPLEAPKVFITPLALDKMYHYVDIGTKEVGWLGTAFQQGSNYVIEDVFLIKQQVHATTTEITPSGLGDFAMEILETKSDKEAERVINNLRFWGHSHVNMGTSPSGQDEHQMELFQRRGHPWFVRAILNKMGRIEITVFDYRRGLKYVDAEWAVLHTPDPLIREAIESEFHEKVTEMGFWGPSGYDYLRPYQRTSKPDGIEQAGVEETQPQDTAVDTEAGDVPSIDEPAGDGPPVDLTSNVNRAPEERRKGTGAIPVAPSPTLGERFSRILAETGEGSPEKKNDPAQPGGPKAIVVDGAPAQPRKRRWYFLWLY